MTSYWRAFCLISLMMFVLPHKGLTQSASTVTINLNAVAGLQFDQARFQVKPGAQVKIILKNQDDMSHNMLITKPGRRAAVVEAAMKLAEKGPEKEYIPDSPDVLWSIRVLSPGETGSVTFTAPREAGIYPYVCTFPGHGFSMYGAMYVQSNDKLPNLKDDLNIPESRRKDGDGTKSHSDAHASHGGADAHHPHEMKPPYLYRAYMANSGPASIAVHLPNQLSYCWDAETCELRYAWTGDFVDNTRLWKGKPNAVAEVKGQKFFEIRTRQPLRIGSPTATQQVEYKGYKLVDRYPEFHYTINGVDVYELVKSNADGTGLVRTFRIPEATHEVWFLKHSNDGARYESSIASWDNNRIRISPEDARNFTITMTKMEGKK